MIDSGSNRLRQMLMAAVTAGISMVRNRAHRKCLIAMDDWTYSLSKFASPDQGQAGTC